MKKTEVIIITPEYDPRVFDDRFAAGVPIHEVDSTEAARSVFEDILESGSVSVPWGTDHLIPELNSAVRLVRPARNSLMRMQTFHLAG